MIDRPEPANPSKPNDETDELLDAGQEEVFSRAEVELGRIEHSPGSGHERARDQEPGHRP